MNTQIFDDLLKFVDGKEDRVVQQVIKDSYCLVTFEEKLLSLRETRMKIAKMKGWEFLFVLLGWTFSTMLVGGDGGDSARSALIENSWVLSEITSKTSNYPGQ